MKTIDILKEPTGVVFRQLLTYLARSCHSFSLVRRDQSSSVNSADHIEQRLLPFLMKASETNLWPGTQLLDNTAMVSFYRITPESLAILRSVRGLYSFLEPQGLEDLAFYRADGTCFFGSIAHERDAWFEGPVDIEDLKANIPDLKIGQRFDGSAAKNGA